MNNESDMFAKPKKYLKDAAVVTLAAATLASCEIPKQNMHHEKGKNVPQTEQRHNNLSRNQERKHEFPVFQEYAVGQKSLEELRSEVAPMILGFSGDMMNKLELSHVHENLKLVKISVADLGFNHGATYAQILNRAKELGLKVCPAEVGPGLRVQYVNQPEHDKFYIAMTPIVRKDQYEEIPLIFDVECEKVSPHGHPDGLYLFSQTVGENASTGSDWVFKPDESFVFVEGK